MGKEEEEESQPRGDPAKVREYMAKLGRSGRNRESGDEIAELEARLRRAYVAKELRAQILEREADRLAEDARRQRAAEVARLEQRAILEDDVRRKSASRAMSEDYGRELTVQMRLREEERRATMEEARRDRQILAEVDRIREERETLEALRRRDELSDSARRERLIFQGIRRIREDEAREAEVELARKGEAYSREVDERGESARKLREERLGRRERAASEIADRLMSVEARKREMEALTDELIAEDVRCELLLEKELRDVERRRMREELAANLKEQITFAEECKLRFVERDRMFAEDVMRRIMEDERTARLTAAARRRAQLRYREDLARLVECRRRIREEEILRMELADGEERKREGARLERVKDDRRRLLEAHASNLGHFIDKGALHDEERRILEKFTN
ncbi:meiosis-specific nuclear structural protein 1-like [Frieseomelitta varia]|uniref:meiosis-specific nuclear structural protein 1-like n=1 Tax=Frieseomelitta varia TaxID=561572 RepID=UPI001CB6B136|nr:meiosis-specific nuclear structural protein 1-like [Frieseomelitta varia]